MIAIKDMDMPTGCNITCPCRDAETGFCEASCVIYGDYEHVHEDYYNRPNDCPLIEIEQSEDCVSRQAVIDIFNRIRLTKLEYLQTRKAIEELPSATPTHGMCKDCEKYNRNEMFCTWHGGYLMQKCDPNFYCADWERRE